MKNKISIAIVLIAVMVLGISFKSNATEDGGSAYKKIIDKKCYTNGYFTGWKNDCGTGLELCIPTNCTPA